MNRPEALRYAATEIENRSMERGFGLRVYLRNQARTGVSEWLRSQADRIEQAQDHRLRQAGCICPLEDWSRIFKGAHRVLVLREDCPYPHPQ